MKFDKNYYFGRSISNYQNYRLHKLKITWWSVLRILKQYKGGTFLDVGCAFGFLVHYATPYFTRVVGVDISEFALKEAKTNFPNLEFYVEDVMRLPFSPEEFSMITALDVLEHTTDLGVAVKEIYRVLKPEGFFFCRMPYNGFWRKIFGKFDKDISHISILKAEDYREIVEKCGFRVIKSRTISL